MILSDFRVIDDAGKISPAESSGDSIEVKELRLEFTDANSTLVLMVPSMTERNLWMKKLESAKRQFMEKEQSHLRRQLSSKSLFLLCFLIRFQRLFLYSYLISNSLLNLLFLDICIN